MNKKILVIGAAVIMLCLVAAVAFAATYTFSVSFSIINADTFEVIQEGTIQVTAGGEDGAKSRARQQLGFGNGIQRTVNGVKQRLIWVSVVKM